MISEFRNRTDKPHVYFECGFWRVNPTPRNNMFKRIMWVKTHNVIVRWNASWSHHFDPRQKR